MVFLVDNPLVHSLNERRNVGRQELNFTSLIQKKKLHQFKLIPPPPPSTPVLAGGLFLVSRQRWEEIGGYDPGFLERGGDSIEMSLKSWMCGGQVLVAPCSRVGHLFVRSSTKKPGALLRNTRRIAEVWLDDFKQFYYDLRPQALYKLYGDISPQLELKKRLKCQDFSWYLKKVYPELTPPRRLTERHGKLRHQFICLSFVQAAEHRNADSQAVTETAKNFLTQEMCSAAVPFELTTDGLLRVNDWCLSSSPPTDARVLLKFCGATTTERWQYDNVTGKLVHVASNWCLDVAGADSVITQACVDNPRVQTWSFE
ncbi:Ricin B lectin domain [Trinorchestia longiramus]|nr:Ricin B lectin domain [Trinorchestia longiramus]